MSDGGEVSGSALYRHVAQEVELVMIGVMHCGDSDQS
jgi:hypothetical protein